MTLKNRSDIIANKLTKAKSVWEKTKGLIGKTKLENQSALWIDKCNSIHTCFMRIPIDVIFADKDLKVHSLKHNLKPWKIVWPQWGAKSVFELPAGTIKTLNINAGDQLYVED